MKTALFVLIVLSCAGASAGEIYGRITIANEPAAELSVTIKVTGADAVTIVTDEQGDYRAFVTKKGKGTISVTYEGQKPESRIVSYDRAVRYSFTIVQNKEGNYELMRK